MLTLIAKEIRLIRGAWIGGMILAVLPIWLVHAAPTLHEPAPSMIVEVCFSLGAMLVCLAPLGQEFQFRTFTLLLVQPKERREIFMVKSGLSAIAAFSLWMALYLSTQLCFVGRPSPFGAIEPLGIGTLSLAGWSAWMAFVGGLWAMIWLRQLMFALLVALMAPGYLYMGLSRCFAALHGVFGMSDVKAQAFLQTHWQCGLAVYGIAGIIWARWQFLNAEDVAWSGGSVSVPGRKMAGFSRRLLAFHPTRSPGLALVQKEFLLQHVSLLLAGLLVLANLVIIAILCAIPKLPNESLWRAGIFLTDGLVWGILALSIGGQAAADERRWGTMDVNFCLPVSRAKQFAAKLVTVALVGAIVGLLAELLLRLGAAFPNVSIDSMDLPHFGVVCGLGAAISIIGLYGSTLTRHTLQALVVNCVAFILVVSIAGWLWKLPIFALTGGSLLALTALGLAYWNYGKLRIAPKVWWVNAAALLAALGLGYVAGFASYIRAWEIVVPPEPKHGAARLSGPVRPQITFNGACGALALLPDGRIWYAEDFDVLEKTNFVSTDPPSSWSVWAVAVKRGAILPDSNWKKMAFDSQGLCGLRSDGTLWRISFPSLPAKTYLNANPRFIPDHQRPVDSLHSPARLQRIGSDFDWTMLDGNGDHAVALKSDRTLWAWGNYANGQFGITEKHPTLTPLRVGNNSNWVAIGNSFGVKSDGSIWAWGRQPLGIYGYSVFGWTNQATPLRVGTNGTNWISLDFLPTRPAVRADGTLWMASSTANNQPCVTQIGKERDWAKGVEWLRLKTDGRLVATELGDYLSRWWGPSHYGDWIGIGGVYEGNRCWALASDGTLCVWSIDYYMERPLLGPSRKPEWTLNILDTLTPER